MQALILATDEASKLHPLTEHVPAPLLPVLNRPIMAYGLELLVRSGVRDIGVAVYNKAGRIEAHFATGSSSGAQLTYLLQREPLGSAGSLRWAASGLRETFVVLPGDAIVDVDICAALAFHRSHGGIATVIVHAPRPGYPLQAVGVAPDGRVSDVSAQPSQPLAALPAAADGIRTFAATGAYIFEPWIFDWIPSLARQDRPRQQGLDCHSDLLPRLLGREAVHAYVAEGYWNPIHDVPAYHQAQLDALTSAAGANSAAGAVGTPADVPLTYNGPPTRRAEAPGVRYVSVQDRELAPGIIAGRHVSVHPSAHLVAPVYIGAGSQIERDVELGPGVVIGANTIVDEGATIRNSSVLEGTYVGRLVKVDKRVVRGGLVIDAGSGDSLRIVDPFLLGEVSPRLIVRPMARLLSRAADCAGALLLLLLFLPVVAFIALALLLTSPLTGGAGRVLEHRSRVRWRAVDQAHATGEDEKPGRQTYGVLHFRTRRQDGAFVPLGAFLERTQLDRLPALLSVLKGDLRLVGVKPLDPSEADRLVEEWQRLPYEGPAGFTGLWYVGLPQQGADAGDLDEIAATDAYYTATRGFLEDLYLWLITPAACIRNCVPSRSSAGEPERTTRGSSGERYPVPAGWHRRLRMARAKPGGVGLPDSAPTKASRP